MIPEWLQRYQARGFKLLLYPAGLKGPRGTDGKDWQEGNDATITTYNGENVGVFTGAPLSPGKYLVDVDLDWGPAVPMVKRILRNTNFGYGRGKRPLSHLFYTTSTPLVSKKYMDIDQSMLVELRGTCKDGSLGVQTMMPPSLHPDGEHVKIVMDGELTHDDDIDRRVLLFAVASLLFKHLGSRGFTHDVRLSTAGFLYYQHFTSDEAILIGEAIASLSANDPTDVRLTVETTYTRVLNGEKVTGQNVLRKQLGDAGARVLARIKSWLGTDDFARGENGIVLPNERNLILAFERLNAQLSYDTFANRMLLTWDRYKGPVGDHQRDDLFLAVKREFSINAGADFFDIVLRATARANSFHPILEYLNSLVWDGTPRIANWLIDYAGAGQTEADSPAAEKMRDYVRAVSSIVLIAAVRRIRKPGCKFDELLVLESTLQGKDKSTALRTLCPNDDWFSDNLPLNVDAKQIIEQTAGKWIIEAAELSGMTSKSWQVEHLKAMLSRQVDGPVRMAYARMPIEQPRQFIMIGTTNNHSYLQDDTGNRRFWPMRIQSFDVAGIRANRDQLWAEAAQREARGESIRLDQDLWEMASLQQERRRIEDPWEEAISDAFPETDDHRLAPEEVWDVVDKPMDQRGKSDNKRVSDIMQRLGFRRMAVWNKDKKKTVKGWARDIVKGNGHLPWAKIPENPESREQALRADRDAWAAQVKSKLDADLKTRSEGEDGNEDEPEGQ